jgi:hypothetical protein
MRITGLADVNPSYLFPESCADVLAESCHYENANSSADKGLDQKCDRKGIIATTLRAQIMKSGAAQGPVQPRFQDLQQKAQNH